MPPPGTGIGASDGIIYATISTKRTPSSEEPIVLCSATSDTVVCSSMENLAPRILSRISLEKATKMSYSYEKLHFHLVVDEHVCYMCLADADFGCRIPYDFLEKTKNQFRAAFAAQWHRVRDLSEQDCRSFVPTLKKQMRSSNEDDKIKQIGNQVEATIGVMQENIESILSRGERIDILVARSSSLQGESRVFERRARGLKWEMCKRRALMVGGAVLLCAILLLIILMIACNPNFEKCK
eukprot:TRINITY_DN51741_c0_g1_i1.p1 TRINITY_DN51741_c0_g1~~TRINITY_DN51741_c0_g1_i1.p1  ORF type:complete len:267 (+),score=87.33 TRINITY_DN51741_c0_g1_i1:87-803(+)